MGIAYRSVTTRKGNASSVAQSRVETLNELGADGWRLVTTVTLDSEDGIAWEGQILDTFEKVTD